MPPLALQAERPFLKQTRQRTSRQPILHSETVSTSASALQLMPPVSTTCSRSTIRSEMTEYVLPDPTLVFRGIATGPDGSIWFTAASPNAGEVRRIGPGGVLTEFRITTSGAITEFAVPALLSGVGDMTVGPGGKPAADLCGCYIANGLTVTTSELRREEP